jgi:hypothetical protein
MLYDAGDADHIACLVEEAYARIWRLNKAVKSAPVLDLPGQTVKQVMRALDLLGTM